VSLNLRDGASKSRLRYTSADLNLSDRNLAFNGPSSKLCQFWCSVSLQSAFDNTSKSALHIHFSDGSKIMVGLSPYSFSYLHDIRAVRSGAEIAAY